MNRTVLLLRRVHLLNKRFLKTPVFIMLLLLLPLSALSLNRASRSKDIGIKVGYTLSQSAGGTGPDEYTKQAMNDAFSGDSLVKYEFFSSESQLEDAVTEGKISVGFAIPSDLQESFREFEKGKSVKKQIGVIVKKNTVVTRLITELIFGRLFSRISCQITRNYIARLDDTAFTSAADQEVFNSMYNKNRPKAAVFSVEYAGPQGQGLSKPREVPLLAAPVRGLCSIFLLILGFAAAFYYIRDDKNGLFVWFSRRSRLFLRIFYIFLPVFDACLVMILSLYFSGTFEGWTKEVPLLLAYSLATAAFCAFFCAAFNDEALLAGAMPLILLATFIVCPVFISINAPAAIQKIFPPYLYLTAIHKTGGIFGLLLYAGISLAAALAASALRIKTVKL
ncbi:MAG: ABC transporter permease [Treponema sp.]|nr:ABC transporter permease [Treponema sp.]